MRTEEIRLTDAAVTDDAMTAEATTDAVETDDAMTAEAANEDATTDDAMTGAAVTDDAMTGAAVTPDAVPETEETAAQDNIFTVRQPRHSGACAFPIFFFWRFLHIYLAKNGKMTENRSALSLTRKHVLSFIVAVTTK